MDDEFVLEPILQDRIETLIELLFGDSGMYYLDPGLNVSPQQFLAEFLRQQVISNLDVVDRDELRECEPQCMEDTLPCD
jgi:hypothetical protein